MRARHHPLRLLSICLVCLAVLPTTAVAIGPVQQPAAAGASHAPSAAVATVRLDDLLAQLRRVIPDELQQVPPAKLTAFVKRYQGLAAAAGVNDLDRQTQYLLVALYTSGKGQEQDEFKRFMAHAPADLDPFYDGVQKLSDGVWNAGPPLWDSQASPATKAGK